MSVTIHQRPGVYSSYDASSVVSGSGSGRLVGLAGVNTKATAGEPQTITSYEKAAAAFGSGGDEDMAELIRLALKNGASGVVAMPVASSADYETAFAALAAQEDIAVVLCDSTDETVQQKLKESVQTASADRRERLAVVAGAAGESESELVERAEALNCERVVLVAPGRLPRMGRPCPVWRWRRRWPGPSPGSLTPPFRWGAPSCWDCMVWRSAMTKTPWTC